MRGFYSSAAVLALVLGLHVGTGALVVAAGAAGADVVARMACRRAAALDQLSPARCASATAAGRFVASGY